MASFAFANGEPVDAEARRLAKEGAARVLSALANARAHEGQSERLIHDARRMLKRLRALVRLISGDRASLDALRDAGRALGAARDAAVMVRTFDAIAGDDPRAQSVRTALVRARKKAAHSGGDDAEAKVRAFAESIDGFRLSTGWDAIAPGLRRTYRDGRRALERARDEGDAEALHALRRRCKDLQYQLALLRNVWPPVIRGYGEAARELGQLLGEDHDLAVLRDELSRRVADPAAWHKRIDKRRRALQERIFPLSTKLYFDPPRLFVDRFETWWSSQ